MNQKQTILLKISGASLKDVNNNNIIDKNKINNVVNQISEIINEGYSICIVMGGGNIWRGILGKELSMDMNESDSMGMLATIMNSLSLSTELKLRKITTKVFNSFSIDFICEQYQYDKVQTYLNQDKPVVAIFAGGTGNPFFTTDTAAALRCSQLNIKTLLMAKNGVAGVFDKDPNLDKDAQFYSKLTFEEILTKELKVMDQTALTMCKENDIDIFVFNIETKDSIIKIFKAIFKNESGIEFTKITKKGN